MPLICDLPEHSPPSTKAEKPRVAMARSSVCGRSVMLKAEKRFMPFSAIGKAASIGIKGLKAGICQNVFKVLAG